MGIPSSGHLALQFGSNHAQGLHDAIRKGGQFYRSNCNACAFPPNQQGNPNDDSSQHQGAECCNPSDPIKPELKMDQEPCWQRGIELGMIKLYIALQLGHTYNTAPTTVQYFRVASSVTITRTPPKILANVLSRSSHRCNQLLRELLTRHP